VSARQFELAASDRRDPTGMVMVITSSCAWPGSRGDEAAQPTG
jgi:hypothetical protein